MGFYIKAQAKCDGPLFQFKKCDSTCEVTLKVGEEDESHITLSVVEYPEGWEPRSGPWHGNHQVEIACPNCK